MLIIQRFVAQKQVSILNKHILHRWRAGKPRPYGGSVPLGNPKI
jgi:hypothetical protein